MSDSPEPQNSPVTPLPDGKTYAFDLTQLRYRQILELLVWHPKLAIIFLIARKFWLRTALTAMLLCCFGGCAITMGTVPKYGGDIYQATEFIVDTLGEVEIKENRITWDDGLNQSLPAMRELPHGRIDIMTGLEELKTVGIPEGELNHANGVVLAQDGICYWQRLSEDYGSYKAGDIFPMTIPAESFNLLVKYSHRNNDPRFCRLNESSKGEFIRQIFAFMMVFNSMNYFKELFFMMVVSALIMSVSVAIVFRSLRLTTFLRSMIVALNLSLLPMVATVIFKLATGATYSLDGLYLVMFGVYVIYIIIDGRRGELVDPPPNMD